MSLLKGFHVLQQGPGLAAAVAGRLFADIGAEITRIDPDRSTPLAEHLNAGPTRNHPPHLIICEQTAPPPNPQAPLVMIAPFGQTGPRAKEPANDLTLFFASGIARMLTGQVDDLNEPPMAPIGHQSAMIAGLTAACAGMHAALLDTPSTIDVSIQEALATLAITELTRAVQTGKSWSRKRQADGNDATVCILPASDGHTAISPREDRQWAAWLTAMRSPEWGNDPRFATKKDRIENWDALHEKMSAWSHDKSKQYIAATAQAAHVPSFPLYEPIEHLASPQLQHRGFFRPQTIARQTVQVPSSPFGLHLTATTPIPPKPGPLPLTGIRVLDFSWVIAGPTATRYLAAMGAEVLKIEAPNKGDPGRASELHTVLGQAKKSIVLDLKDPVALATAKSLAAKSDILVENFATGVMDRLGLGAETLRTLNPNLIYISASGLGRTGPESHAVAYGTLLQCYAGFAGLNRHPGHPPRVGMAWLDPMCGLMLAFIAAASLWARRNGTVARVDFSMLEGMLWTMAEPLLTAQNLPAPPIQGAIHRNPGPDDWLAVDATHPIRAAATLARSTDLVACPHLNARGFWDETGLPGLPWKASFGRATGPAPELGADTATVLHDILGRPLTGRAEPDPSAPPIDTP